MKDTLVIMGSHPMTRGRFDFERDDCDIWVFNEAPTAEWVKRADATLQMHNEAIWRNPMNVNDTGHFEWLKSQDAVEVIMQEVYPEVPRSSKYPLDDVLGQVANFIVNDKPYRYFTSSPAYALALGVQKGYKRIEIYGVEMATDTEYRYQRDGVAFWLGVAAGKGIEVVMQTESFFKAPLYGYTADVSIPISVYEETRAKAQEDLALAESVYRQAAADADALYQKFVEDPKFDPAAVQKAVDNLMMMAGQYGRISGVIQECNRYLLKHQAMREASGKDGIIVRQEHERTTVAATQQLQRVGMESAVRAGVLQEKFAVLAKTYNKGTRKKRAEEFAALLEQHLQTSISGAIWQAAVEMNRNWLQWLDEHIKAAGGQRAEAMLAGAS